MLRPVDDVLAAFFAHQRLRAFSEETIQRRESSLRRFATMLRPRHLFEAEVVDIETWLGKWANANTRYSYHCDLRALYKWAVRRKLTTYNPTDEIDAPRRPRALPKPISDHDVHRLLDSTTGPARRATMLAAYAGLRVFEIAKADARDLHGGHLVVRGGKGQKDRAIPLSPELEAELCGLPDGPLVGGDSDSVYRLIGSAMRRLKICGTPHQLRHSFGTAAAASTNGNLMIVAELMGHSNIETTRGYVRMVAHSSVVSNLYPRTPVAEAS